MQGASLLGLARGEESESRPVVSHWPQEQLYSLMRGEWKLVRDHDHGRSELYDLGVDPGERIDRAGDRPDVLRELERELLEFRDRAKRYLDDVGGAVRPGELSRGDLDTLGGLGYLDGGADAE